MAKSLSRDDGIQKILFDMSVDEILAYFANNRVKKIRTHGNSAVITLPKDWLRKLDWTIGSRIKVALDGHRIIVSQNIKIGKQGKVG